MVGSRRLRPTPVFGSYWHLAAERQSVFFRRVRGEAPPWTMDPVIGAHRFTNTYRASDRVSQYLINEVVYAGSFDAESTVLRILLFKIFNRVETWQTLERESGPLTAETFDAARLTRVLDSRMADGGRLYSAAYIMPSPQLGQPRKHANHLLLLEGMLRRGIVGRILDAKSLQELFGLLSGVPSFGPFLAFQFAIDLNYSDVFDFSEMDFVVAGPGARDGIAKCFEDAGSVPADDLIRAVAETADQRFEELGISFQSLWGRPLQLIDCQNLFCEVSKYSRVAHPEVLGTSGRTRIKQRFAPAPRTVAVSYPPKWGLPVTAGFACDPARVDLSAGDLDRPLQEVDGDGFPRRRFDLSPDPVAGENSLFPVVG